MGWADVGWSMIVTSGFSWWVRVFCWMSGLSPRRRETPTFLGQFKMPYKKEPARKGQNINNTWMKFEEWLYIYISIYNIMKYLMFHLESLERNHAIKI
jgi:hypothetical protein